jgi:hypothetical protein
MALTSAMVERFKRDNLLAFRRSLYQRQLDGEVIQAGEYYIYLNAWNEVEERRATPEDIKIVCERF